jgi:homoserine dehydrogenase
MQQVNLGMIGGGTVGSGVFHALQLNGDLLASRIGVKINVSKVAVKALDEPRPYPIPEACMTTEWQAVLNDPQVQVIIELVGGTGLARTIILAALKLGKPVITANKALLSAHGEELFAAAKRYGTNLYYEASVCGGIPIIKDAQAQGYAEAEASLDIDGHDALHKVGILASLAHGFWVKPKDIHVTGIRNITALDIKFADQLGYTIKLLGIIKAGATRHDVEDRHSTPARRPRTDRRSRIQVSVYPTLIPNSHVLASVNHVFNAVFVRGDIVGDTLFYGRGAGKDATASAVLSDIADAALDLKFSTKYRVPPFVPHESDGAVLPIDEVVSRYFLRLDVIDVPGTLARISKILGDARIGISSVIQPEGHEGASVPLIFMLHDAPNGAVSAALKQIGKLSVVKSAPVMLRVETFD